MRKLKLFSLALMALFSSGLWADSVTFSASDMSEKTSGNTKGQITVFCPTQAGAQQAYKSGSAVKYSAISMNSSADTAVIVPASSKSLHFRANAGYKITGISIFAAASKDSICGEPIVIWTGAINHTPAYVGTIEAPSRNGSSDPDPIVVTNIPNGATAFAVYRRIKYNSTTGEIGSGSNFGRSQQTWNIFSVTVTYEVIPKHSVEYNLSDATGTTPTQDDVAEGAKFTLHDGTTGITSPEGKEFAGWNDGTTTYAGGAEYTMGTSNVTLTAQWVKTKARYAITYNKGAYGTGTIEAGEKVEDVAFTLSASMFTREGYLQIGWATSDGGAKAYDLGGSYTANAAITLYPAWAEKDTYTATFAYDSENPAAAPASWTFANAGTYGASDATVAYEGSFGNTCPAEGSSSNDNYVAFAKNPSAVATYDLGYSTTISAVTGTFYVGSNSAKTFTIDYLAANGSTVLHTITINHPASSNWGEDNVNETTAIPNVRYIKVKPMTSGNAWIIMSAFSVTYGVYVAPKYDVTYKANGGTGDDVLENVSYVSDNTFTAPTGKTFVGWNTKADGTGDAYAAGDEVTSELTLYAQWINIYTVTFNLQDHGDAIEDQIIIVGEKVEKPADPFAIGYVFGGWYKEAGCVNSWDFANDVVESATELYAKWTGFSACATIILATSGDAPTAYGDETLLDNESTGGTIIFVGAKDNKYDESFEYTSRGLAFKKGGADSVLVTLTSYMKAGSIIQLDMYSGGTGTRGLKILKAGKKEVKNASWTAAANDEHCIVTYVLTGSDGLEGKNIFCLSRNNTVYLKQIIVGNCGDPTALDNTVDEAKAIKRIENGMLIIEKNGKLYNMLGERVK